MEKFIFLSASPTPENSVFRGAWMNGNIIKLSGNATPASAWCGGKLIT